MYKEVAITWKNKESYVDEGGVFGLSIIKHVTLQKIVAHDFRYDPRTSVFREKVFPFMASNFTLFLSLHFIAIRYTSHKQRLSVT